MQQTDLETVTMKIAIMVKNEKFKSVLGSRARVNKFSLDGVFFIFKRINFEESFCYKY